MRQRPALVAGILGGIAVVLIVGTLVVGTLLRSSGPECTIPRTAVDPGAGDAGQLSLDAVQLQHASTINAVGLARGAPDRARVIAIATAWQESSLRNIDYGDRDSLGLFQQRPSQGWGDVDQVQDPVYAAGAFYDALSRISGWESMPLTEAAQAVQRSAYPDAYAKWEDDSRALTVELSGEVTPTLSCRRGATASTRSAPIRPPAPGMSDIEAAGAAAGLAEVVNSAHAEFGNVVLSSDHDPGQPPGDNSVTVTVSLPGMTSSASARALAAWAVAHSTSFGIEAVAWGDTVWSGHAWRPAEQTLADGTVRMAVTVG